MSKNEQNNPNAKWESICKSIFKRANLSVNNVNRFKIYTDTKNVKYDKMTEDVYKIGVTTHISKRICQYRTANTYEPRLHYYFPCQDVKAIEEDLNIGLRKFSSEVKSKKYSSKKHSY